MTQLSYEEKILSALASIPHDERDGIIDRAKKRFIAVRQVLKPLYAELEALKALSKVSNEMLDKLSLERDVAKAHALECSLALEKCQARLKEIRLQDRGYGE